jgi:hypothetical protein
MITIRQIERSWTARTYEKLFRELVATRPEAAFRFEHEQGRAIPAAAMAVIRLDELSQSYVPLCAKLVRAVIAGQEADGGWGDAMTTALCLRALLCSGGDGVAVERGLQYLANLQKLEGVWPAVPLRRMPADGFASAFVLYELGDDARFRDAVHFDAAVRWFEQHEGALDPQAKHLWDRARHRCRSTAPPPASTRKSQCSPGREGRRAPGRCRCTSFELYRPWHVGRVMALVQATRRQPDA